MSISIRVTVNVIMTVRSRLAAADMSIKCTSMAAAAVMTMATMDRIRRNCCA